MLGLQRVNPVKHCLAQGRARVAIASGDAGGNQFCRKASYLQVAL